MGSGDCGNDFFSFDIDSYMVRDRVGLNGDRIK